FLRPVGQEAITDRSLSPRGRGQDHVVYRVSGSSKRDSSTGLSLERCDSCQDVQTLADRPPVARLAREQQRLHRECRSLVAVALEECDEREVREGGSNEEQIAEFAPEREAFIEQLAGALVISGKKRGGAKRGERICGVSLVATLAPKRKAFLQKLPRTSVVASVEHRTAEAMEGRRDPCLALGSTSFGETVLRQEYRLFMFTPSRRDPAEVREREDKALTVADLATEGRRLLEVRQRLVVVSLGERHATEAV